MNWVPLLLTIARGNLWYGIYYFIKAVTMAGADINSIGIKIIPLFNRFVIINNTLALNLILVGRFVIKFINIFYQMRWGMGSGFKNPFFYSRHTCDRAYTL